MPLLVVSPYTPPGYVSGALPSPGMDATHTHDFGSVLAYTEQNFNLPFIDGPPNDGYADYNAPDWGPGTKKKPSNTPLLDFFGLYPNARSFASITTDVPYTFFKNANNNLPPGTYPADPDDDTDSY